MNNDIDINIKNSFKILEVEIEKAQKDWEKIDATYSDTIKGKKRQDLIKEIKDFRDLLFQKIIKEKRIEERQDQIKQKFVDQIENPAMELLIDTRYANDCKAQTTENLIKKTNILKDKQLKPNEVHILAGELLKRGKNEEAHTLMEMAEANNYKEPFKNDPEYQELERLDNQLKVFQNDTDYLYLKIDRKIPERVKIDELFPYADKHNR